MPSGESTSVLGARVDELNYTNAINLICRWAENAQSRFVCFMTVHMIMEAYDDPAFRQIVNTADLVGADGMPVMWSSRLFGLRLQTRVTGPKLMGLLCAQAAARGIAIGFYGSTQAVIDSLKLNLQKSFPDLKIVYAYSPPFRTLQETEKASIIDDIKASGARLVFVGLGCPKQERWINETRSKAEAVFLGVGYAFDVHAEMAHLAPEWMQKVALEWFYRLLKDPKRLWKRYLMTNSRYLALLTLQAIGLKKYRVDAATRGW